ncbi:MAG: LptF/LptG family permease [Bdellovibrionota bacterium]
MAKYILFELLPTFVFSVAGFVFLLTMAQTFRLGEYILIHRAQVGMIGELLFYMTLNTLSMVLPMAMLFSVILTYGRMSQDSEIVAFKALGLGLRHLLVPALVMGVVVTILAAQLTINVAPWGSRKSEELAHQMRRFQPMAAIREGVFSEGFFDLVVYANKVDPKTGLLSKIFIFDDRASSPVTIVAPEGRLVSETVGLKSKAFLRLYNGDLHRSADEFYTKINFENYDINFFDERQLGAIDRGADSLTMQEIDEAIPKATEPKKINELRLEWHRRLTLPFATLIFTLIGVGLGTVTNRRAAKSGNVVMSISIFVTYWLCYATAESFGRGDALPMGVMVWIPNILFLGIGIHLLRRAARA